MITDRIDRMVLKFRDVLAETERLRPDKLRIYQENLLAPLILHAQSNVPFYATRLARLGHGREIGPASWEAVPVLTRAEVQRHADVLKASTVPPHAGAVTGGETSGSIGRPVRYLTNELAGVASLGATDRAFRWWQFDGAKTMASFVARTREGARPPDGKTVKGWRVGAPGLHYMIDMSATTNQRIDWLRNRHPHYLTAHSFTLMELAEQVRARGVELRFERITSIGTVLTDEIRDACTAVFGARTIDQYGAQETGLLASECPWCGEYHVNAETVLVEILDQDGRATAPGAVGRVVATSLYNYAMPLIRYEIGDLAVAGSQRQQCPVTLPALGRILGRYRNAFTLPDGRTVYPYVPVSRLRQFLSFEQFQIVQTSPDAVEVRYVPLNRDQHVDADGLEACLRELIDPGLRVHAVAVNEIARSPSGKFEDYLSLVPRRQN